MNASTQGIDRRRFLNWAVHGLGATAFTSLLRAEEAVVLRPHLAPKARRVINICLVGGYSQIDSFDYKPELTKFHGKTPPGKKPEPFFGRVGLLRKNDWAFRQRGQSGLWVSDLFPHLAKVADELTVIRSMYSDTSNHTPALFMSNSGFQTNGFPSLGGWLSYGLGNASDSLPAFVVIPDRRGAPSGGSANWNNGFLPGEHQGVVFRSSEQPVRDLFPPKQVSEEAREATDGLLAYMQHKQLQRLGGVDDILGARLRSYELAARMQVSVPEVADLDSEPRHIAESYGLVGKETGDFARNCILARRLVEQGVRFVQLFNGAYQTGGEGVSNWDGHKVLKKQYAKHGPVLDQPVAALLADMKQRGLLEQTLVVWCTEFGRMPTFQAGASGRDHNPDGFTAWLAGAGVKRGHTHGATDDFSYKAVKDVATVHDFHATILHLLGLEHERLTFYHNGLERRLTDVAGEVIEGVLA